MSLEVDVNLGGGVLANYDEVTGYLTLWRNSTGPDKPGAMIVLDAAMYHTLYNYMEA
jgi:hypothetical protein